MSVKIAAPGNGAQLSLSELVEFQGAADEDVVTISLISPLGTNKFLLGKAPVVDGKWSLSYKFNTGGEREIIVSGFDVSNNMISSDQSKIQLQADEDSFDFSDPTNSQRQKSLTLWATHTHQTISLEPVPMAITDNPSGTPLSS